MVRTIFVMVRTIFVMVRTIFVIFRAAKPSRTKGLRAPKTRIKQEKNKNKIIYCKTHKRDVCVFLFNNVKIIL